MQSELTPHCALLFYMLQQLVGHLNAILHATYVESLCSSNSGNGVFQMYVEMKYFFELCRRDKDTAILHNFEISSMLNEDSFVPSIS